MSRSIATNSFFVALTRIFFVILVVTCLVPGPESMAQPSVPALTGRVVDRANVLSDDLEVELTDLLAAHESATSNQVVVLTVSSLGGHSVEDYSLAVAREWELGTSASDNGILFLLAIEDREMRIEVGYGLEGALPDAAAGRILRNEVRPSLRKGDYDGGVRSGVSAVIGTLEGTYEGTDTVTSEAEPPFWFGFLFMIIPSFFVMIGVLSPGGTRWFLFLFLVPFFAVSGLIITRSPYGAVAFVILYAIVFIALQSHPKIRSMRKTMKDKGSVKWGPITIGGSGGSGGFGGGGGFSGGGGSFGGGGASSSW